MHFVVITAFACRLRQLRLAILVHVLSFAAHERLIDFNRAASVAHTNERLVLHSLTNSVEYEPC